jgi:hypothetical protein
MHTEPRHSQRVPAQWTGASALIAKWLNRRCAVESVVHLAGGAVFLVAGLVALVLTSCVLAALVVVLLVEGGAVLSLLGLRVFLLRPVLFAILFLFFMGLSILHAYKTRWGTEAAAQLDFGTAFASTSSIAWEFLAAGPIMLIMSGQDFHKYLRLTRLDIPHVSSLLLWLYDKGGRAGFAEISLAFPGLNAVRVLPQLRDLPGLNWWPDDGEISLTEEMRQTFTGILGRGPKNSPGFDYSSHARPHFQKPVIEIDQKITAWYAALNLPLFATLQQVKKRYRKLAKIHHPDVRATGRSSSQTPDDEAMKRINEAYHNILKHSQNHAGAPD